jgi:hypothetical protein
MHFTEIPAGVTLPKTAEPARDERIESIRTHGDRLVIVYTGHWLTAKRQSSTRWAKTLVRKPYMRVVTWESKLDDEGEHLRWVTISRKTMEL